MTYQALALVRNHKSDEIVVLKQTRLTVQKELRKRDDELLHLKDLLSKSMRQRNVKGSSLRSSYFDKHQETGPLSGIFSIEDEPRRGIDSNNGRLLGERDWCVKEKRK
jgi:hypothetical protein